MSKQTEAEDAIVESVKNEAVNIVATIYSHYKVKHITSEREEELLSSFAENCCKSILSIRPDRTQLGGWSEE